MQTNRVKWLMKNKQTPRVRNQRISRAKAVSCGCASTSPVSVSTSGTWACPGHLFRYPPNPFDFIAKIKSNGHSQTEFATLIFIWESAGRSVGRENSGGTSRYAPRAGKKETKWFVQELALCLSDNVRDKIDFLVCFAPCY